MSLISDLTALKAELQQIPIDLGVPQYRSLTIHKAYLPDGALIPIESDLEIEPNPYIVSAPSKLVGLPIGGQGQSNILIEQTDLMVSRIPRTYTRSQLLDNASYYLVDGSIKCKYLQLIDKYTLDWRMLFRPFPEQ
ncbi:MAG: hypothetical protein ACFE0I_02575 [Elainellaceae cyanobacterium]